MTIFKPRCPALHPDNNSRCGREEGHDDPHRNFTEKEWDDMNTRHSIDPQDTDGGVATGTNNPCPDPDAHWRLDEALERAEKAEELADTRGSEIARLSEDRNDWEGNALDAEDRAEKAEKDRDHWQSAYKGAAFRREEAEKAEGEAARALDAALDSERKALQERDDARHEVLALRDDLARAEAINREITNEMVERGRDALRELIDDEGSVENSEVGRSRAVWAILTAARTEPTRPHGAEELEEVCAGITLSGFPLDAASLADYLASHGVRVTGDES